MDKKKTEKPTALEKHIMEALKVFQTHFAPAETIIESDEQMTTSDICEHLQELMDAEITKQTVFTTLKKNGYQYAWHTDGFKWLLKINSQNQ